MSISRQEVKIICLVICFLCTVLGLSGEKLNICSMNDGVLDLDVVPAGASSVAIAAQRLSQQRAIYASPHFV